MTATVRSTEASPPAVEWLEQYLHDGPRYSAQLRRDALADGIAIRALHQAANELGVARVQASRWSRWSLAEHAEATAERRCPVCHEVKDIEQFRRPPIAGYPAGRLLPVCNPCTDRRSCRRAPPETTAPTVKTCCTCGHRQRLDQFGRSARRKDGLDPRCRSCSSVAYRQGPGASTPPVPGDPAPAIALREELAAARQAGQTWADAWPAAVATALETSAPRERDDWEKALASTRGAWEDAYDREDAQAAHGSLAMLAEAA